MRFRPVGAACWAGVELTGLAFGSPKNTDDPWLKAEKVRLEISLCQLLAWEGRAWSIEIDGSDAARCCGERTAASSWPTSSCLLREKRLSPHEAERTGTDRDPVPRRDRDGGRRAFEDVSCTC